MKQLIIMAALCLSAYATTAQTLSLTEYIGTDTIQNSIELSLDDIQGSKVSVYNTESVHNLVKEVISGRNCDVKFRDGYTRVNIKFEQGNEYDITIPRKIVAQGFQYLQGLWNSL